MHMSLASPWGQHRPNQGNTWENIFICIFFFSFLFQLYANKVVMIKGDGGFFLPKILTLFADQKLRGGGIHNFEKDVMGIFSRS